MQYLITSLGLGNVLKERVQGIILTGSRGQMESGGDDPGMGSLGWFWVVAPTTCWATSIVTRMIPSRTAFFMVYEAAIFMYVVSPLDQG